MGALSPIESRTTGQPGQTIFADAVLRAGRVGIALRSTGPELFADGPRLLAVAVPDGEVRVFDLVEEDLGAVADALSRVTFVGHDLKLALAHLQMHHGIEPAGVFDTAIAWKLLDGGEHLKDEKFFTFTRAYKQAFGAIPAAGQNIDYRGPLDSRQRDEIGQQAREVLQLEQVFRADLQENHLNEVAELEFALLPIVVKMEIAGVPIDRVQWEQVTNALAAEAADLKKKVTGALGIRNIDDNNEVLAALTRRGIQVDRTNSEALDPYMNLPFVEQLVRYRKANSFVTSAGKGVLRALDRSGDGRVHATLKQLGAITGRMSCEGPNLLGLPREPSIRSCIASPPGMKLVIGDYNAIEMRVLADQTGDEQLRRVFAADKGDPHRHTASLLMGKPEEQIEDDERQRAKPVNFGTAFGMGKDTLMSYAQKNYHVELTPAQAERFRGRFLEHYAGVRAWQKKTQDEMPSELRTRSGRVTYYLDTDEGYNARLSFPIQGTAADGMKQAIVMLHPLLEPLGARIILAIHDELIVEAPDEHAEEVKTLMCRCMTAAMQKYVPSVPIVIEPEVWSTWAKGDGAERPA